MEHKYTNVNVSTITILKVVLVMVVLWFLFTIKDVIVLLLISIIISSAIDPLADYLHSKKIPRVLGVLFVFLLFIGLVALVIGLMIPPIIDQFNAISQNDFYDNFTSKIGGLRETLHRYGVDNTVDENIKGFTNSISQGLFNTTRNILTGFISVITVIVVSFYLSAEENGTKNFIKHLVPFKNQPYITKLATKIQKKIGHWVIGQLILCLVIFAFTYIGLLFLHVDYALVLALIAGVLEIVPYIGPIIALFPAAFFAFIQNPPLVLAVIILYLIIQQLENHLLVPMIMSRSVGLNPILVILGVLVGSTLGGVIGAVIAVPILSGIQVFLDDVWGTNSVAELEEELET